jgi:hypothetical protein
VQRAIGLHRQIDQAVRGGNQTRTVGARSRARHDRSARKVDVDRERIAIAETFLYDGGMTKGLAMTWAPP